MKPPLINDLRYLCRDYRYMPHLVCVVLEMDPQVSQTSGKHSSLCTNISSLQFLECTVCTRVHVWMHAMVHMWTSEDITHVPSSLALFLSTVAYRAPATSKAFRGSPFSVSYLMAEALELWSQLYVGSRASRTDRCLAPLP